MHFCVLIVKMRFRPKTRFWVTAGKCIFRISAENMFSGFSGSTPLMGSGGTLFTSFGRKTCFPDFSEKMCFFWISAGIHVSRFQLKYMFSGFWQENSSSGF